MKIHNLIEQFNTSVTDRTSNNTFKDKEAKETPTSGAYGRVFSKGNPHEITKIPHNSISWNLDDYLPYIQYVIDNNLAQSNPHFPRVYTFNKIKDKKGYIKYNVDMEKLTPLSQLDNSQVETLLHNYFDDELINDIKLDHKLNNIQTLIYVIDKMLIDYESYVDYCKMDSFSEACEMLVDIKYKFNLRFDIHNKNVMIRLGSIPQIVFTDPFG